MSRSTAPAPASRRRATQAGADRRTRSALALTRRPYWGRTAYGREAVLDYFARRRELAGLSFRMHPGEVLVGDGDHVASLTDGTATIGGVERSWSTIGLYRVRDGCVAACWLLPLDEDAFDAIWADRG